MKDKLMDVYEEAGCLVFTICIILALGLVFGVYCLEGWLLMLVWNAVAVPHFSAPILGYWAWVGIVWALNFIVGLFRPRSKD